MPSMLRVKVKWSGFSGAPGWSNFYFADSANPTITQALADAAATKTEQFFNACMVAFPSTIKSTVQSDVEQIDIDTGVLQGVWTVPSRTGTAGTNAGSNYSGASGMVVTWRSSAVRLNRLMRGRTFLVPTAVNVYENDGTIISSIITSVTTAATALIADTADLEFGIYARPRKDSSGNVTLVGAWANASGFTIPDKVAVLRSRRD